MQPLENIHLLNSKIKSVTFFNWMVDSLLWGNIIDYQKNATRCKGTLSNALYAFLSTTQ